MSNMADTMIIEKVYFNSTHAVGKIIDKTCCWTSPGALIKVRRMLSYAVKHCGRTIPGSRAYSYCSHANVDELKCSLFLLEKYIEEYKIEEYKID